MTWKTTFRKCEDIKVASEVAVGIKTVLRHNQKSPLLLWPKVGLCYNCEKASCTVTLTGEHLLT